MVSKRLAKNMMTIKSEANKATAKMKEQETKLIRTQSELYENKKELSAVKIQLDNYARETASLKHKKNDAPAFLDSDSQKYLIEGILPDRIAKLLNAKQMRTRHFLGKFDFTDTPFEETLLLGEWHSLQINSGLYFGEVARGTDKPEGRGAFLDSESNLWETYWKNGRQTGQGRAIEHDGNYFIGTVVNGFWKSYGRYDINGTLLSTKN